MQAVFAGSACIAGHSSAREVAAPVPQAAVASAIVTQAAQRGVSVEPCMEASAAQVFLVSRSESVTVLLAALLAGLAWAVCRAGAGRAAGPPSPRSRRTRYSGISPLAQACVCRT